MAQVLILDDDADLRELLGEYLAPAASSCVLAAAYVDLERKERDVLACDLAILDINLGPNQPSGVDAYRWLLAHGFRGKIVFLTGHAASSDSRVAEAETIGKACVFEKPLDARRLFELVKECV
jgi:DNA-binding NtrC family response regulator